MVGRLAVWWCLLGLAVPLAGCGAERAGPQDDAAAQVPVLSDAERGELDQALAACTATTGYDPEIVDTLGLGETELAAGEVEFRACAYDALARIVRPTLRLPALLDELIAVDRRLTAAIPVGGATRSVRTAALDNRIAQLREQENAIRAAEMPQQGTPTLGDRDRQAQLRDLARFRQQMDLVNRLF